MSGEQDDDRHHALLAHERTFASQNAMFQSVLETGSAAIRSVTLIAGGSVVVGLAFAGSIYASDKPTAIGLLASVFYFAIAAVLAGAASGVTYLSQACYTKAAYKVSFGWKHPYVENKSSAKGWELAGDVLRALAVVGVVASYLLILLGVWFGWEVLASVEAASDCLAPKPPA